MQKLLETGKTSLLKGFVSNRTRKKFSAYLTRDAASGKVGFEFEARVPRAPKAAKAAPKTEPAAAQPTTSKGQEVRRAGESGNQGNGEESDQEARHPQGRQGPGLSRRRFTGVPR